MELWVEVKRMVSKRVIRLVALILLRHLEARSKVKWLEGLQCNLKKCWCAIMCNSDESGRHFNGWSNTNAEEFFV